MRSLLFTVLTFLLMASSFTLAASDATRPTNASGKGIMLSGKVSDDGTRLVADDDNDWAISNIESLKRFEGRYVTVKCRMDLDKRAIRVLYVEESLDAKHAAHLGDAAFRR